MADRRHRLRRALTLLSGTFGALVMLFALAPNALAACEDAKQAIAQQPPNPDPDAGCKKWVDGRCVLWFDGQIYLGSGNRLPLDESEREPLPPNRFKLYALVSPCDGGGPPPERETYTCKLFTACPEPDERLYQVWSRYYEEAEPEWQTATDWALVGPLCVATDEGAPHDYLPENARWIAYIASYPGGDLHTQPSNGQTLVGFPTNFYTELPNEIRYSATHNSGEVSTCVEPKQWVWDFDDGDTEVTHTPGAPYEPGREPEVTHVYQENRQFEPSVSVRYKRYLHSENGWSTTDLLHDSLPGQGHPLEMFQLMPRLISPFGQ